LVPGAAEGEEEVVAHDRHPAEHGDAEVVQQIADDLGPMLLHIFDEKYWPSSWKINILIIFMHKLMYVCIFC
jgi:hypothetical protein